MITLGEKGAVLASEEGCYIAAAPEIEVKSTIGAGDSSIAGFLAATKSNLPYAERLATAVCYGSAACMNDGTEPPKKSDIETLLKRSAIKPATVK